MIVIGGGAAGLTAAGMSALLGAKTALIEEQRLGGDCTWVGCVPSKTLLRAAKAAHEMKTAGRFGLIPAQPQIPFAKVMNHVRQTRQHIYDDADAPPNMERLGMEVIIGSAHFSDPHALEVRDTSGNLRRITSRFFVIATGSRPKTPPFTASVLTNETIFELEAQPKRLLIVGGGPVGIEMAQAFERLGSEVTVVAPGDCILPKDDPEQARQLQECLSREGVSFILGQKIMGLEKRGDGLVAVLRDGRTLMCDAALAAIGREPAVKDLQLEKAGVEAGERGIKVDRRCRTSQAHIYATGDVTGRYQFTHMGEHMSKVAVTNALLRWPKALDERHVVWSTFTDPELAHLGESEADLRRRRAKYSTYRFPFAKLDRAITEVEATGEVKVFAGKSGRILGASILGAHAGEMIAEYALAMRNGIRLSRIAETIHAYPTYMLGNRRAADQLVAKQLDSRLLATLGRILGYRGERRGSSVL
jgi:pyruvate/2-oxoglutarate dehydrogenase complex dihydrolipoamide dehydrogenase (E3) component